MRKFITTERAVRQNSGHSIFGRNNPFFRAPRGNRVNALFVLQQLLNAHFSLSNNYRDISAGKNSDDVIMSIVVEFENWWKKIEHNHVTHTRGDYFLGGAMSLKLLGQLRATRCKFLFPRNRWHRATMASRAANEHANGKTYSPQSRGEFSSIRANVIASTFAISIAFETFPITY